MLLSFKGKVIGITPAKREARQIKCQSCGAPIKITGNSSIVSCEFCRSVYDVDSFKNDYIG